MGYKSLKRNSIDPVEPPCRKTIYHSKEEAEDMITYINENRSNRSIRVYQCTSCGFWHLTSKNS